MVFSGGFAFKKMVLAIVIIPALLATACATAASAITIPVFTKDGKIQWGVSTYKANGGVDKEVKENIRNNNLLGHGGNPDDWTYYFHEYKNHSGVSICDDTIGFPPGVTIPRYSEVDVKGWYWKVDGYTARNMTQFGRLCSVTLSTSVVVRGASFARVNEHIDTFLKNIETTCVSLKTSKSVNDCKKELTLDANICRAELTAGVISSRIDNNQIAQCISDRSGEDIDTIRGAFTPSAVEISSKCDVKGVGWLVCQLSKALAFVADGAYTALSYLMETPPLSRNSPGGAELYQSWSAFRNIANVVFIFILLVVIYSQVTGGGFSNYTLKKIAPRLIVGAALINTSYYICAIIIDISNIAGTSIHSILTAIAMPININFSGLTSTTLVLGAGVGMVVFAMNITALITILTSGVIALFITLVLLLIRQALLITLIVIAPVAFSLNILPNTQGLFNKWWKSFVVLAMLYPAIGVIYGGSKVASGIIAATAPSDPGLDALYGLLTLGVLTVPFFITPILLKLGGGLLNRFAGIVNNPNKGPGDYLKRRAGDFRERKENIMRTNAMNNKKFSPKGIYERKKARHKHATSHHESLLRPTGGAHSAVDRYNGDPEVADEIANKAAAGSKKRDMDDRVEALQNAIANTTIELSLEDVDAEEAVLTHEKTSTDELRTMSLTGLDSNGEEVNEAKRAAATRQYASSNTLEELHTLIDTMCSQGSSDPGGLVRDALATGIKNNPETKNATHLNGSALRKIETGNFKTNNAVRELYHDTIRQNGYTQKNLSNESSYSLKELSQHSASLPPNSRSALHTQSSKLLNNAELRTNLSPEGIKHVRNL